MEAASICTGAFDAQIAATQIAIHFLMRAMSLKPLPRNVAIGATAIAAGLENAPLAQAVTRFTAVGKPSNVGP